MKEKMRGWDGAWRRRQARLAQAHCHVAAAAGRRHHVDEFVLDDLGVLDLVRQLRLRMGCRFDPLQPAGDWRGQRRRARRVTGCRRVAGIIAMKINCVHGSLSNVSEATTPVIISYPGSSVLVTA